MIKRIALASALMGLGLAVSGCASDYYGRGYGSVGYYDEGYGYGAPYSYYGWYGGFYYPGTGFYVYDRYRRPFLWSGQQRAYWEGHRFHGEGNAGAHWDQWQHAQGAPGGFRAQGFRSSGGGHGGGGRGGGHTGGGHGGGHGHG